ISMDSFSEQDIQSVLDDRYKIISRLGQGGMSVVYKAEHRTMQRVIAVKLLHSHLSSDPESFKRFQLEAKAVSSLKHPNVVNVYAFGLTSNGQPYLVSDFIQG